MVAGPAAADAVRRARCLPALRVGLHLVVVEGAAALPGACPHIVDAAGQFPSHQVGLGFQYWFSPRIRRQLALEIAAQYRAFYATGLMLDHANAHKHMHLHPTVGRLLIEIGAEFRLRAVRIPFEPGAALRAAGGRVGWGGPLLGQWTRVLRGQARRAGLVTNDQVFGMAWSGHMTADRLVQLASQLPPGLTEIYFHPAAYRDARLDSLMPDYEHEAELAALLDPEVRQALAGAGAVLTHYGAV